MLFKSEALLKRYQGFSLAEGQHKALAALLQWREAKEHGVLEGFAGTGKTTVVTALIAELALGGVEAVHVAAPTHKAAKVLNTKLDEWRGRVAQEKPGAMLPEATTIHSLLALRPKKVKPSEPEGFVVTGRPRVLPGSYLIIDECSMVGKDLYAHVMECAAGFGLTVLFTGDPKQLRPVNEPRQSLAFGLANKVQLTEVLRHDGAVLKLATDIRTMHKHALPRVETKIDLGSRVVAYKSEHNLEEAWLQRLEALQDLDTEDGEESPCVMVCWTNKARRAANKRARVRLYGADVPDFMVGDRLVMLAAHTIGENVVLSNNADVEVTAADRHQLRPVEELDYVYDCWRLSLRNSVTIYVLTEEADEQHKKDYRKLGKEISALQDQANERYSAVEAQLKLEGLSKAERNKHPRLMAAMEGVRDAKEEWSRKYYPLKEAFASVDFGYALTVHKSQGSTYDVVYAHPDMLQARDERPALMYVAVTRAAKEVHHLALPR